MTNLPPKLIEEVEAAMQKASEMLNSFEGEGIKIEEWQACYAHLFNQMAPVFLENKKLHAAIKVYDEVYDGLCEDCNTELTLKLKVTQE
jgi:hypothetical protein